MGIIQDLKTEGVLKLYMPFGSRSFDDFSGNSHDGTPTGVRVGREGMRCINLPAAGSEILSIPNHADFDFGTSTDFSIYAWFQVDADLSARNMRLFSSTDATGGVFTDINNNIPRFFFEVGANYTLSYDAAIDPTQPAHLCWVFDRDVSGYAYYNGSLVASTETNPGDRQENLDTTAPLNLGKVLTQTANLFSGIYKVFMIVTRVLTATEVSQIKGELEGMNWPSKTKTRAINNQQAIVGETGLVGAWDMKPVGGVVQDLSGNGNDMTIGGRPSYEKSLLGDSMDFHTETGNYLTKATFNNLPSTAITVSAWMKVSANVNWNNISNHSGWPTDPGSWILLTDTNGAASFGIIETGPTQKNGRTAGGIITPGIWQHVVGTYDGTTVKVYVDGVIGGTTVTTTTALDTTGNIDIGDNMQGSIADVRMYNVAKDQAWVTSEYEKGANAVPYKTDFAANVSTANVTAGEVENTGWTVVSGSFQVQMEDGTKIIKCIASGAISKPTSQDATEASFGTWEMDIWKDLNAGIFNVGFAIDQWSPQNGYIMQYFSDEKIYITEYTGGGSASHKMSDTTFAIATWHNVKIRRTSASVFSVEMNGTVLDTPWTDASGIKTAGNILALDMDTGDKIKLSNVQGDEAFTKKLGVV